MEGMRKYTLEIEIRSEISAMWPSSGCGRKNLTRLT